MVNHNSNWFAYPMSETVILNPLDGMSCENCENNVFGNPWGSEETLTSNVSLHSYTRRLRDTGTNIPNKPIE